MVAANLAAQWGHTQHPQALVDLRLTGGDLQLLLDLKVRYTLAHLCDGYERMDASMLQQALVDHPDGFRLLAAPQRSERAEAVTADAVGRMLSLLQASFQRSVVEIDRSLSAEQIPALTHADVILLIMRLDMVSLHHSQQILDHLDRHGIQLNRVRVVVNRSGQPKELSARKAEEVLQSPIFHLIPDDAARVNLSVNKGVAVVNEYPHSRVARSLRELAEKIAPLKATKSTRFIDPGFRLWKMRRVAAI